ncbi:MAG: transglycosylase domain-containing protein [Paracoccaceae bacterium]|nr:transglycosylase domain-containing protein [Paracoccaceae bacterium]
MKISKNKNSSSKMKKSSDKRSGNSKRRTYTNKKSTHSKPLLQKIISIVLFPFIWSLNKLWAVMWRTVLFCSLILFGIATFIYITLPPYEDLVDGRARGSVTFLDKNGNTFAWRGDQLGDIITSTSISPMLKNAIVATEDKRYYRHFGISPRGILGAIKTNLKAGRGPLKGSGGSTITQQTAKLICLGKEYNPNKWESERQYEADCRKITKTRKIKEAIFAVIMEFRYTKDEILSLYLNRAYLGAGSRGFEAASQRYFNTSSSKLNIGQSAMLAGLLKAPSTYAPTSNIHKAQARANVVLKLMHQQKYITNTEKQFFISNPANLSSRGSANNSSYFVDWIMGSIPPFLTRKTMEDVIIKTTFDSLIQSKAERAVNTILKNKLRKGSLAEIAVVIMSPDGAVRGMIGGREANKVGSFNRATQAKRQTGSIFKPLVYATALEKDFKYNTIVEDTPISISVPGSGTWTPKNYSRDFIGKTTLTDAFKLSINTVAVKLSEEVGRDNVIKTAKNLGLYNDLPNSPSVALGTSEHTLLEITGAYAGILNGGKYVTPYGLTKLRLKNNDTPLMEKKFTSKERTLSQNTTEQLIYMMHRTLQDGTGTKANIKEIEVAGKTGTTQNQRDAWFIGFTTQHVVGVWMGNDKNLSLTGVTGGGLPAEIWREIIIRISDDSSYKQLPMIRPKAPPTLLNGTYRNHELNLKSDFNIFKSIKNLFKQ